MNQRNFIEQVLSNIGVRDTNEKVYEDRDEFGNPLKLIGDELIPFSNTL